MAGTLYGALDQMAALGAASATQRRRPLLLAAVPTLLALYLMRRAARVVPG